MSEFDLFNQSNIYNYGKRILAKFQDLVKRFDEDSIIPDQVEIHLPPKGNKLCWFNCPHCYTHSGREKHSISLSVDRLHKILQEISYGHPQTGEKPEKIIISGFNTDPLNSSYVEGVLKKAKSLEFLVGVHTKGLKMSSELIEILTTPGCEGDYISFSIDAGSNHVFNIAHGVKNQAPLFTQILGNLKRLIEKKKNIDSKLKIITTYLITSFNSQLNEVENFAKLMLEIGVDYIRFSEPIHPYMGIEDRKDHPFPHASLHNVRDIKEYILNLKKIYKEQIHYLDFPSTIVRILPCYSRWMMPTIGYDGYLYSCCLTASDQFNSLRIANLNEIGFWEAYFKDSYFDFNIANCQCDRKASFVNSAVGMELNGKPSKHDI